MILEGGCREATFFHARFPAAVLHLGSVEIDYRIAFGGIIVGRGFFVGHYRYRIFASESYGAVVGVAVEEMPDTFGTFGLAPVEYAGYFLYLNLSNYLGGTLMYTKVIVKFIQLPLRYF